VTKKQIEYLKYLGYEETMEEGAILQHMNLGTGSQVCDGYVWCDDTFLHILHEFPARLERSIRMKIGYKVINDAE
jgi:hypothetical protein